ncbi:hypothetical protein F4861DRAFT_521315 [Xylaria intraflava]|nr:hypothetical protein F4861DRAFT_521315 [Xylaria intraflava]
MNTKKRKITHRFENDPLDIAEGQIRQEYPRPNTVSMEPPAPNSNPSAISEVQQSHSITISDDLSHSDKVEQRQFLALQPNIKLSAPPAPGSVGAHQSSHALQDYQMQLMLLEQQGKKRFIMAQQEQERQRDVIDLANAESTLTPSQRVTHPNEKYSGKRTRLEYTTSNTELDNKIFDLDLDELRSYMARLEQRARDLGALESNPQHTYSYCTLYRISQREQIEGEGESEDEDGDNILKTGMSPPFFDPPQWVGTSQRGMLKCYNPVDNFDLYLEQNKDLAFIVYKTYTPLKNDDKRAFLEGDCPKFKIGESIKPITRALIAGVRTLLGSKYEYSHLLQNFERTAELHAPYLFVYHQRADWERLRFDVTQSSQVQLTMLWNYIVQSRGKEYAAADRWIASGKITPKYIQYLFKPGDVLIERDGDFHLGWVATSWPTYRDTSLTTRGQFMDMNTGRSQILPYSTIEASKIMANEKLSFQTWYSLAWHWDFDGNFQRKDKLLEFAIPEDTNSKVDSANISNANFQDISPEDGFPIRDLRVYPIRHAPTEIVQKLRKRGKTFWRCRLRGFVSYEDHTNDAQENMIDERYMIDLKAYRSLHKNNQYDISAMGRTLVDGLGPEAMKKDEPPDDKFELLLPPTIKGFNMNRKKWYDLAADRVNDVNWNKEAFQKIVMNRKAKDLIQALVSNQLAAETNKLSADLIEGKGNGLILLLHGSPGTGKTLTAESVAEIAERPLYKVTCADIGTKAEDAEKYLESVLHLGKLWKCVVLLDEADVFLEQRSLEDLARNALVSVFLRVLEYYEGILILTSNRVGTFDEAFKSRIQLALHYPALGPYERLQIWQNFFEKLDNPRDATIDIDDLRDHLVELKEEEMNGRQIRNAITTARQYAKWKGETLTYAKLKDVIEVAGRFDKYLNRLHRGLTQDQLAEDEGVR